MFGIGTTEFILLALVVLIFVGPKHLPDMLRKFGKVVGELRYASRELRTQIETEIEDVGSPSKIVKEIARDLVDDVKVDMPSPYDELKKAVDEQKSELKKLVEKEPETDSSADSKKDSGQA